MKQCSLWLNKSHGATKNILLKGAFKFLPSIQTSKDFVCLNIVFLIPKYHDTC